MEKWKASSKQKRRRKLCLKSVATGNLVSNYKILFSLLVNGLLISFFFIIFGRGGCGNFFGVVLGYFWIRGEYWLRCLME